MGYLLCRIIPYRWIDTGYLGDIHWRDGYILNAILAKERPIFTSLLTIFILGMIIDFYLFFIFNQIENI